MGDTLGGLGLSRGARPSRASTVWAVTVDRGTLVCRGWCQGGPTASAGRRCGREGGRRPTSCARGRHRGDAANGRPADRERWDQGGGGRARTAGHFSLCTVRLLSSMSWGGWSMAGRDWRAQKCQPMLPRGYGANAAACARGLRRVHGVRDAAWAPLQGCGLLLAPSLFVA